MTRTLTGAGGGKRLPSGITEPKASAVIADAPVAPLRTYRPPAPVRLRAWTLTLETLAIICLLGAGVYQLVNGYRGDAILLAICLLISACLIGGDE